MTALVVGIGNRDRGDDGAGPEAASRVAGLGLPDVTVMTCDEPLGLLEHLGGYDAVVVIDAAAPRGRPGTLHVVEVGAAPLRRDAPALGSHGFGAAETVELARVLGRLPRRLTFVGVEAHGFTVGESLSTAVRDGVTDAVRAVTDLLRAPLGGAEPRPSSEA